MTVTHSEIFDTAVELEAAASNGVNIESNLRSAASRAYYAAMHASLDALPAEFSPTKEQLRSEDSHVLIQDAMAQWGRSLTPGRTEALEVARDLPRLKKLRKSADYAISHEFPLSDAQEAMRRARKVIQKSAYAKSKHTPVASVG